MFTIDKSGNAVFAEGIEEIKDCLDYKTKKELKKAVIPPTVKRIGRYAFYHCNNLEEIVLPEGLEFIGGYAFSDCTKLKSFVMPDSVNKIEDRAFYGISLDEPVFNHDKTILYLYNHTRRSDTIILPDTVKRIFSGAFTGNVFGNIILHDGIEQIDSYAFFDCILCDKITVNCITDAINDCAFWNFRPSPELIFPESAPEYTEILRMFGKAPVERIEELQVPILTPLKNHRLKSLVKACSTENPDTMTAVADFFLRSGKGEFFEAAANFWFYRAMYYGSERAKKIINEKCRQKKRSLPAVTLPDIGNEDGERLNALGFTFFSKKRKYSFSLPDENGIVEVISCAGSDGPDEDGFGREEYYDWWLLDENLNEIPNVKGIFGYSNLGRRNNEKMFEARYNYAVKHINERKEIRKRVEALFDKYENENK